MRLLRKIICLSISVAFTAQSCITPGSFASSTSEDNYVDSLNMAQVSNNASAWYIKSVYNDATLKANQSNVDMMNDIEKKAQSASDDAVNVNELKMKKSDTVAPENDTKNRANIADKIDIIALDPEQVRALLSLGVYSRLPAVSIKYSNGAVAEITIDRTAAPGGLASGYCWDGVWYKVTHLETYNASGQLLRKVADHQVVNITWEFEYYENSDVLKSESVFYDWRLPVAPSRFTKFYYDRSGTLASDYCWVKTPAGLTYQRSESSTAIYTRDPNDPKMLRFTRTSVIVDSQLGQNGTYYSQGSKAADSKASGMIISPSNFNTLNMKTIPAGGTNTGNTDTGMQGDVSQGYLPMPWQRKPALLTSGNFGHITTGRRQVFSEKAINDLMKGILDIIINNPAAIKAVKAGHDRANTGTSPAGPGLDEQEIKMTADAQAWVDAMAESKAGRAVEDIANKPEKTKLEEDILNVLQGTDDFRDLMNKKTAENYQSVAILMAELYKVKDILGQRRMIRIVESYLKFSRQWDTVEGVYDAGYKELEGILEIKADYDDPLVFGDAFVKLPVSRKRKIVVDNEIEKIRAIREAIREQRDIEALSSWQGLQGTCKTMLDQGSELDLSARSFVEESDRAMEEAGAGVVEKDSTSWRGFMRIDKRDESTF